MGKLQCPECGNKTTFYRDISIEAKLKVDSNGKDLKTVYDVNKSGIDSYFLIIYCGKCQAEVLNES